MEKLEMDKKFRTISIRDDKINENDDEDGDDATVLSSDNK